MSERRTLVLMRDEQLLDEVLRLAAAAGCVVECAPDVVAARAGWIAAPLIVLDEEMTARCVAEGLPRRGSVVVVCAGEPAPSTWQLALSAGVEQLLCLPVEEPAMIAALADVAEGPDGVAGRVLAVVGGRGGGGASVFAAAVAITASRSGTDALLLDCDQLGGGLDVVLGAETAGGLRWPELSSHSGRIAMSALWEALPDVSAGPGRLVLLSCAREGDGPTPDGVAAVLEAGRRSGCTVVCDLPRSLDATSREVIERADLVVMVVPAEVRAGAAAKVLGTRIGARARSLGLVVRGPAPDGLPADAVAAAIGLPLLAVMRPEPGLDRCLDRAEFDPRGNGPLAGAARAVLAALGSAESRLGAA